MARNFPKSQHPGAADDAPEVAATNPGGSSGVPDDPNLQSTEIGGPKVREGLKVEKAPKEDEAPAVERRFRVVGGANPDEKGRFRVMYDGMPSHVAMGKEYSEHQVDLDHLRKQGIRLEEIALPVPA